VGLIAQHSGLKRGEKKFIAMWDNGHIKSTFGSAPYLHVSGNTCI
jgi:hypothetical protein